VIEYQGSFGLNTQLCLIEYRVRLIENTAHLMSNRALLTEYTAFYMHDTRSRPGMCVFGTI